MSNNNENQQELQPIQPTLPTKPANPVNAIKIYFEGQGINQKFKELLGNRSTAFLTSVMQIVASNDLLQKATPESIYQAAAVAAILDLPLNNTLGFAYIVPYGKTAQFQLGYKGFWQLAMRSGQFENIGATEIYEGQIVKADPLEGYEFDFTVKTSDKIIGYASSFRLLSGFKKTLYMSIEELRKHAGKYSQTYKKNTGKWVEDFHAMCLKTVIKLILSRYAPLSVEMQKAVIFDQSTIIDAEKGEVQYPDNSKVEYNPDELWEEYQFKIENIPTEDQINIERILKGQETASYAKVAEVLSKY